MTGTSLERSGFRLDIQGMRAIAVLLVLLYHAGVPGVRGGYIGVDVFFVISGFLITTHIVKLLDQDNLHLRTFWSRRIRRLLPASWSVAAITAVLGVLLFPPIVIPRMLNTASATFAYVPNILFAVEGTDYLANKEPSVFQHYWSLGVEEQFYLIWPILLLIAFRLLKGNHKGLLAFTALLTLTSFLLGWKVTYWHQSWAFFLLPTRAWELGIGAVLAIGLMVYPRLQRAGAWKAWAAWGGLAAVVASAAAFNDATPFPGWEAAIPSLGAFLMVLGGTGSTRGGATLLLATRPLVFLGKISYSVYLVHWPLIVIPQTAIGWENPLALPVKLGLAALALPLGWLSWRFIEEPFRSPKRWGAGTRRTLLTAVVGAAALALTANGVGSWFNAKPIQVEESTPTPTLSKFPTGTSFVPENMDPSLQTAMDSRSTWCHALAEDTAPEECTINTNPDAPLVALWGDSHANSWSPPLETLAESGQIRLEKFTKTSCGTADLPAYYVNGDRYPECDQFREEVLKRLAANPPDVVVIGNYSNLDFFGEREGYQEALERSIRAIPESSTVIVMEDVPQLLGDPLACLSAHVDDADACAPSRDSLKDTVGALAERNAAAATNSVFFEVTDYLCAETCPLVRGSLLVYMDEHHLTGPFSELFAEPLLEAITAAGERG